MTESDMEGKKYKQWVCSIERGQVNWPNLKSNDITVCDDKRSQTPKIQFILYT